MFAGAGSVGKTSLLEACKKIAQERNLRVGEHRSTTRDTYARYGFTQETDALKDPEMNRKFQHDVMNDNIYQLEGYIQLTKDRFFDVVFADRTPHDYAAYYFSVFSNVLDLAMIDKKRHQADTTLSKMSDQAEVIIYMLPYPCYWSQDTDSSDGWRSDTTGKNFIWSAIVESEVMNITKRLAMAGLAHHHITVKRLNPFLENGTPEERAIGILSEEFPLLGRRID